MSSPPTATVIVVSHGRPHELEVCLVALCRQRHRAYDIVVVADQPPAFPPTQVQCQYIPFSKRNISEARNLGLVQARGEVVAFVDDDGVPEFDWLDHLTAPFANARVGSAGGWVRGARGYAWQTQTVLVDREGWDRPLELGSTEPVVVPSMPAGLHKTTGTNCAFRRDALCALGGFDPGFAYFLEETDVNLRLAKGGWLSVAVPQAEIHHKTAPSPLRSALRVPLSLKDIGVSRGRFLSKHCPSRDFSTHLRRFSEDQWHKLDRALSLGLMTAAERDQLMEEFQTAMAAGFSARVDALDPITLCTGAIEHLQAPTAPRYLLNGSKREHATQLAADGAEVTVLSKSLRHPKLSVRFNREGMWEHLIPLLGRSERSIQREKERIALRRGPWIEDDFAQGV